MTGTTDKLIGKKPEEILEAYGDYRIPIDVADIAKQAGITLGSVDFSDLEAKAHYKELAKKNGIILGALLIDDDDEVSILYDRTLRGDRNSHEGLSEEEKREKLKQRQRFTIAHELGHYCLQKDKSASRLEFRKDIDTIEPGSIEYEANVFAGKILMPEKLIDVIYRAYNNTSQRIPTLGQLSELFCVSKSAARARLDYLGKPYIVEGK